MSSGAVECRLFAGEDSLEFWGRTQANIDKIVREKYKSNRFTFFPRSVGNSGRRTIKRPGRFFDSLQGRLPKSKSNNLKVEENDEKIR